MPAGAHAAVGSVNCARLSASIGALFPAGVIGAELTDDPRRAQRSAQGQRQRQGQALLTEAEWRSIAHCHERRIRDYLAGRLCAHRALEQFGVVGVSVLSGPDRQPLWPAHWTGSISHTDGYSAAVVGPSARFGALGLDVERIDAVKADLWGEICTPAELERLQRLPVRARARRAALSFVAKEAFYKCQFALVQERLEFDAVWIDVDDMEDGGDGDDGGNRGDAAPAGAPGVGTFWVRPLRPLRLAAEPAGAPAARGWAGHFRCHQGFISAGIAVARLECRQ